MATGGPDRHAHQGAAASADSDGACDSLHPGHVPEDGTAPLWPPSPDPPPGLLTRKASHTAQRRGDPLEAVGGVGQRASVRTVRGVRADRHVGPWTEEIKGDRS